MKLKHTEARKARRFNPRFYQNNPAFSLSVFWRRCNDIYGSDAKAFDLKHPNIEAAVEGYKSRLYAQGSAARRPSRRETKNALRGEDQL